MHYRVYFRLVNSERWIPVKLGYKPKEFAMESDARKAVGGLRERKRFNGQLIRDIMIVSVDKVTLTVENGTQEITLMEQV